MQRHIVIVSPSYGGAEKRFFDIFTALRRGGDEVRLVVPAMLASDLRRDHADRTDVLDALVEVPLEQWSRWRFVLRWWQLLRRLPRGSSFHYPLNCLWFLHLGRQDRVTMTVADCTRVPGPRGGTHTAVLTWIAFHFVRRIDVLSPAVMTAMQRYRSARRMSLTPGGTFLVPPPDRTETKRAEVVFLGRLVAGKGLEEWLALLPLLWERLRGRVPADFGFTIAGYGPLASLAEERCSAMATAGVPVSYVGYASAEGLMRRSAVVVSMQQPTNFPSRVVAEALVGGCGVIVRDSGDSRQFGTPPGLVYCGERLDADEIAGQLLALLDQVLRQPGASGTISRAARERFASEDYVDYFRAILAGAPARAA